MMRICSRFRLLSVHLYLLALLLLLPLSQCKHAYVTLLYDDASLPGVRVLGYSLKEIGSHQDRVVLAASEVSEGSIELLKGEGWTVVTAPTVRSA